MATLTLQTIVLSMFLATGTSGEVLIKNYAVGVHQPDLDDVVFNDHVLFEADVSTNVGCARVCSQFHCCNAFTASSDTAQLTSSLRCRGYESRAVSSNTSVAGSKTYFLTRSATESSWLEKDCANDDECAGAASNTTCFPKAGKCLCQPGYYYSHCRDDCVPDCSTQDLGPQFLQYPEHNINNYNMVKIDPCPSVEFCQQSCLNDSRCRTLDMNLGTRRCFLQKVTALDAPGDFRQSETDSYRHFQRTCL